MGGGKIILKANKRLVRASKAIGVVRNVSTAFECGIEKIKSSSKLHGTPSVEKDISKVLCLLREVNVFDKKEKRRHRSLTFRQGLLTSLDRKELKSRLTEKALNAIGTL